MPQISYLDIRQYHSLDVLMYYLASKIDVRGLKPGKAVRSPLREDRHPSFNIFQNDKGEWRWKDFATYGGSCIDLVVHMYKLSFAEAIQKIIHDLQLDDRPEYNDGSKRNSGSSNSSNSSAGNAGSNNGAGGNTGTGARAQTQVQQPHPHTQHSKAHSISTATRNMQQYAANALKQRQSGQPDWSYENKNFSPPELDYWAQYGITYDVLKQYNVVSVSRYYRYSAHNGQHYMRLAEEQNPIFGYAEPGYLKCYRPLNPERKYRFFSLGKKPQGYVFGWKQLAPMGEYVFLTGGEKDVMSLRAQGYDAITLNSETSLPDPQLVAALKKRFQHVFVLYDNDETGRQKSEEVAEKYGLQNITLPDMEGGKDISDFWKLGHKKPEFQKLVDAAVYRRYEAYYTANASIIFDLEKLLGEPKRFIKVEDCTVSTAGNITTFLGQSKAGKSGVVSGIIAGCIRPASLPIDTMGFDIKRNTEYKAVIHCDTEQSIYDWDRFNRKMYRRAGLNRQMDNYLSLHLLGLAPRERRRKLDETIRIQADRHKGIHLLVLDGIADFVSSVNEDAECLEFIEWLLATANQYEFPVVSIIHLNPAAQGSLLKGRGHLGSHLERKSESVLSIIREGDMSRVEPVHLRNAGMSEFPLLLNTYDKQKGYWVNIAQQKPKLEQQEDEMRQLALEVFGKAKEMTNKEMVQTLMQGLNISRRTALVRIDSMLAFGFIEKGEGKFGSYRPADRLFEKKKYDYPPEWD